MIVWGWATLQWPFVCLSWPGARGSADPTLTLTLEVDPSSAGGIVVSPTAPAPPSPCPFACPDVPQPLCCTSPCPMGLVSQDVGCQCWLLPLAVWRAGVELLGPAGDAGSRRRWAGDDGARGAGLAAGEPNTVSTQITLGDAEPDPDTHLLQRTYGWTVTMLLCGDMVLYDSKADAETRARQQAQR